jgi:hypothetical protein
MTRSGYFLAGFLGVSPGPEGMFTVKRDPSSGVRNCVANPADYLIAGTAWSSQSAADFLVEAGQPGDDPGCPWAGAHQPIGPSVLPTRN